VPAMTPQAPTRRLLLAKIGWPPRRGCGWRSNIKRGLSGRNAAELGSGVADSSVEAIGPNPLTVSVLILKKYVGAPAEDRGSTSKVLKVG